MNTVDARAISSLLTVPYRVTVVDEAVSTNDLARNFSNENAVIIARRQTGGRGTKGRSFFSPDGGLYMSIVLHPTIEASRSVLITAAAAVATARTVRLLTGRDARIKWVNDICIDGKKACGILCESVCEGSIPLYTVVGIGVNAYPQSFPTELSDTACAVFDSSGDINALAAGIINRLADYSLHPDSPDIAEEYRKLSCVIGRRITVCGVPALALDITADCRLCVRYGDGTEAALNTGEVSIALD